MGFFPEEIIGHDRVEASVSIEIGNRKRRLKPQPQLNKSSWRRWNIHGDGSRHNQTLDEVAIDVDGTLSTGCDLAPDRGLAGSCGARDDDKQSVLTPTVVRLPSHGRRFCLNPITSCAGDPQPGGDHPVRSMPAKLSRRTASWSLVPDERSSGRSRRLAARRPMLESKPLPKNSLANNCRIDHSEAVVTIVSGIPGAGKSTVSRLLAEEWPRSVHLEGDRIGAEFIVRGLLHPGEEPADESEAQLHLRRRNTALLADSFASAGFEVVIDDVILWPGGLRLYLDLLRSRPVRFVVLAPRLDVVAKRDAGRDKQVFELWRHLDDDLRRWVDQPGLRLDTSDQGAAKTVQTIRRRWDEALVAS